MAITNGTLANVQWSASSTLQLTNGAPTATSDVITIPEGAFGITVTMRTDNDNTPTLDTENCRHIIQTSPDNTNWDSVFDSVQFPEQNTNNEDPSQKTIALGFKTRYIKIYSESDVLAGDTVTISGFIDWYMG